PHVADVEVAGRAVEAESPGVAEAVAPDLRPRAGLAHERIVRRHRELAGAAQVHPEDLAEQHALALAVAVGITARAAVAQAEVELAVGPEHHHAAVVIGERLVLR